MEIRDWMTPNPKTVDQGDSVKAAVVILLKDRIRHLPVMNGDQIVGIVSDRDIKRSLPSVIAGASADEYQAFMNDTSVSQVMTPNPVTCTPQTEVIEVVRQFSERKFGAFPVVEDGQLVGIVAQGDMMRAFFEVLQNPK